jgi:hypothetical protein
MVSKKEPTSYWKAAKPIIVPYTTCTWIDLVCNDSDGFENYYAAAEELVKNIGARPHLGKYCENMDRQDLKRLHGEHFARFRQLVAQHDPAGKFANDFTRRLFASGVERDDVKGVERAA